LSLLVTGIAFRNARYAISKPQIENAANEVFKLEVWKEAKRQNPGLTSYVNIEISDEFAEISAQDYSITRVDFSGETLKNAVYNRQAFRKGISVMESRVFSREQEFNAAIKSSLEKNNSLKADPYLPFLLKEGIKINSLLVLISILGFIAGFSLSLGPVMWAMFSEIFPNRLRGMAISIVGTLNSLTSFIVATLFPVQLSLFGSSNTFFMYSGFMFLCLLFVWKYVVETKGKSLEELESHLVR